VCDVPADEPVPTATKPDYLVSVTTILRNDEAIVEEFAREMLALLSERYRYFELVLLDNHCDDETPARMAHLATELPGIRIVRLSRPCSLEVALSAALDHAIGDYVVALDCRGDPAAVVAPMVARLVAGADVLVGQLEVSNKGFLRRKLSRASRRLTSAVLHIETIPDTGICHGFTRRALNAITRIRSKSRFILYDSRAVGYRHQVFRYRQQFRAGAQTRPEPFLAAAGGRIQLIIAHSLLPLRVATLLGLLASFANLAYLMYIFGVVLFKRRIAEGWLTTSLLSTVMFLAVFLILAVLTEYVGRILEESKNQPSFFVEEEISSSVSSYDKARLNVVPE
jgi:glycosyltransferase involved in cell wall biosynthesis